MAAPSSRCFETTAYLGCRCTTHFVMENLSWLSVPICSCSVIFLWKKLHHSGWETLKWRPRVTKDQLGEVNSKQNYTSNVILLTSEVLLEDISAQKNTLVIEGVGRSL